MSEWNSQLCVEEYIYDDEDYAEDEYASDDGETYVSFLIKLFANLL